MDTNQNKTEQPSRFIIFESIILDYLNHRQAILMGLLNGMAKKQGYAYLKNSTICELLKASETSVKSDLKRLEELKLIRRELVRNDKKEVIERRIYPMSKFYTEVGTESNQGVGQNLPPGRVKKQPIDIYNIINIIDKEYQDTFLKWLKYKQDINNPYISEDSLKTLAKRIMEVSNPEHFKQVVEMSIMNNWKGLFFDKIDLKTTGKLVIKNKANLYDD